MRFFGIALLLTFLAVLPNAVLGALEAPLLTHPVEEDSPVWKGQVKFEWESTSSPYYRYSIDLPTGEQLSDTIGNTSVTIRSLAIAEGYRWRVSSCDAKGDTSCGPLSSTHTFSVVAPPKEAVGGIVPCDRLYDDTYTTPNIDESAPCGLSHTILLVKNILDFLLWQIGALAILIMAVFTGAFTYFSLGRPEILLRIKNVWKSVLVGHLLALFAWAIVNVILRVFGFNVALFGNWWELAF